MKTLFDRTYLLALSMFALAAPAGCDEPDAGFGGGDDIEDRCPGCGGIVFNTNAIGTTYFSEIDLNGLRHDNVVFEGAEMYGVPLKKIYVTDGELIGERNDVSKYRGSRVIGMVIHIIVEIDKQDVKTALTIVGADHTQGYWRYSVRYTNYLNKEATPTCEQDENGDSSMVLYGNITVDTERGDINDRPDTIYFGCVSGAVGKARTNDWHFAPYDPAVKIAGFEAVVRAIRADYCGDAVSYTKAGNALQPKDQSGYHDFLNAAVATEAVWARGGGATCLDTPRWEGTIAREDVHCADALPRCDSNAPDYYADGFIWSKVAP